LGGGGRRWRGRRRERVRVREREREGEQFCPFHISPTGQLKRNYEKKTKNKKLSHVPAPPLLPTWPLKLAAHHSTGANFCDAFHPDAQASAQSAVYSSKGGASSSCGVDERKGRAL